MNMISKHNGLTVKKKSGVHKGPTAAAPPGQPPVDEYSGKLVVNYCECIL